MSKKTSPQLGQDAVAPPARDLGSLLSPRPRRSTPEQDSASQPTAPGVAQTPAPADEQEQEQPADAQQPEPAAQRASAAADDHLKINRVVYLSDDLVAGLGAACARERVTRTQLVLQALRATHPHLSDLVANDLAPKVIKGDLFDEVVTTHRQNQPAKRQVMIQPTLSQLAVIDRLITDSGARDRSHLIAVALTAHLNHT